MFGSTPGYRRESSLTRRFPLIVGFYLLALCAVVVGAVSFPLSNFSLGLLFFVVGSFFLFSLVVLAATWLLFAVTIFGAIRRRLLGLASWPAAIVAGKSEGRRPKAGSSVEEDDLWDRWIDRS